MNTAEQLASTITRRLMQNRNSLSLSWKNPKGSEIRHFIIDDLLPEELCLAISEQFPQDFSNCIQRSSFRERKKTLAKVYKAGPLVEASIYAFQHHSVVNAIEEITGIYNLYADPYLYAGGISMMSKNDFLNPHIDNSHNADKSLYRRLNLLYYTATNWREDFGGNLELWDRKVKHSKSITPIANRLVVMETNRHSWHSVSPIKMSVTRQCVSNYYFSEQSSDLTDYYNVTSFTGRPDQPIRRLLGKIDNHSRNIFVKLTGAARGPLQQNDRVKNSDNT